MAGKSYKDVTRIQDLEASQAALRKSIEESKRLTDSSQKLLDRHREHSKKELPPR